LVHLRRQSGKEDRFAGGVLLVRTPGGAKEGRGWDEKAVESMSPYTLNLSPLTEGWQLVEHFHPAFCDQNHIFH
jgi:hypothetical protein